MLVYPWNNTCDTCRIHQLIFHLFVLTTGICHYTAVLSTLSVVSRIFSPQLFFAAILLPHTSIFLATNVCSLMNHSCVAIRSSANYGGAYLKLCWTNSLAAPALIRTAFLHSIMC
jgi:hypothetical protein